MKNLRTNRSAPPTRWILLACGIPAAIALTAWFAPNALANVDAQLHDWLNQAGSRAPFFFVITAVLLMSSVMPKTVVSITAGAVFGTTQGAGLVTIIALLTAGINYAMGRWFLSKLIDRTIDRLTDRANAQNDLQENRQPTKAVWLKVLRDLASEGGLAFHLLFRFAPVPSMIVNYSMGAAQARTRPFLLSALVGVLPQLLWVHGGTLASAGQSSDIGVWRWASGLISILAAVIVSIVIPRKVMRRIENENAPLAGQSV